VRKRDPFSASLDALRDQATDVLGQIAALPRLRATWTAMGIDVPTRITALTACADAADAAWLAADLAGREEKGQEIDRAELAAGSLAWTQDAKACLRLPLQRGSVEVQAAARAVRRCLTLRTPRAAGALAMFRLVQPRLDETEALLTPYYTVRPIVAHARAYLAALTALEAKTVALTQKRAAVTATRKAASTDLSKELRAIAADWARAQRRDQGVIDLDLTILRTAVANR
jgi:hypothetical protein